MGADNNTNESPVDVNDVSETIPKASYKKPTNAIEDMPETVPVITKSKAETMIKKESTKTATNLQSGAPQANLVPAVKGGMMIMSKAGELPAYSHKATTKADIETEKRFTKHRISQKF